MGISAGNFLESRFKRPNVRLSPEEYVVGNVENLLALPQVKGRKFDAIVSQYTFMHLTDPLAALAQAYELLAPGGLLIVDHFTANGVAPLDLHTALKDSGCDELEMYPVDPFTPRIELVKIKKGKGSDPLRLPFEYDVARSVESARRCIEELTVHYKIPEDQKERFEAAYRAWRV